MSTNLFPRADSPPSRLCPREIIRCVTGLPTPPIGESSRSCQVDPAQDNRNPEAVCFDNSSNNGVSGANFSHEPIFMTNGRAARGGGQRTGRRLLAAAVGVLVVLGDGHGALPGRVGAQPGGAVRAESGLAGFRGLMYHWCPWYKEPCCRRWQASAGLGTFMQMRILARTLHKRHGKFETYGGQHSQSRAVD